jgi:HYR domain-containing protein
MKHRLLMTTLCAAAVAIGVSTTTALGGGSASGSLQLNAAFAAGYSIGIALCPPGTPATTEECVGFLGQADVPGLGRVTETYAKAFDQSICPDKVTSFSRAVFDVAGKGQIEVTMDSWPACGDPAVSSPTGVTVTLHGRVTGGTGSFAGASGSLTVVNHVNPPSCGAGGCRGSAMDTWTGTLVVPGLEFDLTPPVLSGATSKTVKALRKAKFARVRYAVKAQDDADGSVPVKCKPASGSRFKVGRTKVSCSATDSSANVTAATFTVTVKRG